MRITVKINSSQMRCNVFNMAGLRFFFFDKITGETQDAKGLGEGAISVP